MTQSADPEVKAARARFAEVLAGMPEPKPRDGVAPRAAKERKGKTAKQKGSNAEQAAARDASAAAGRPERFPKRDLNQDGVLDREEFMKTMSGSDRVVGEARFRKLDANSDGRLTQEEFLRTSAQAK